MPTIKRVTLTREIVDKARPKAYAYRIWDAKVPGLALRVLISGKRTYEVHWPRNHSMALGPSGVLTLEAARNAAIRVLGEVAEHGEPLDSATAALSKKASFGEYIEKRYGPHIKAQNKAGEATYAAINTQFAHLFPKKLAMVTKADWDSFSTSRLKAGVQPATINRDLDRLKAALSKAVEWGLIKDNPLRGVRRIRRGIEPRVRYLDSKEEAALRAALVQRDELRQLERESGNEWRRARGKEEMPNIERFSDHLHPLVLLALNTGLRRGELTALKWRDIDMGSKVLTVRAGYAKSGKARHVPLNEEALEVLEAMRPNTKQAEKLFNVKTFNKSWHGVLENAEIEDFRFHDLRHTFASNLVMAGVPLNTVRDLLGHGDIQMTLRYAHLAPSHVAEAVALLDKKK